jgi:hypothetical protein
VRLPKTTLRHLVFVLQGVWVGTVLKDNLPRKTKFLYIAVVSKDLFFASIIF